MFVQASAWNAPYSDRRIIEPPKNQNLAFARNQRANIYDGGWGAAPTADQRSIGNEPGEQGFLPYQHCPKGVLFPRIDLVYHVEKMFRVVIHRVDAIPDWHSVLR